MTDTHMRREILEIPQAVARLIDTGSAPILEAAADLTRANPAYLASIARGSSDHAALYLKYVCELALGLPVASLGPSVASVYGRNLRLNGSACIAVSQSGKSPDICGMAEMATRQGSVTIAITNDAGSDLARACRHSIDICAGPERSVAATKTFVSSAVAGLSLLAHWAADKALLAAIAALPEQLDKAVRLDWSPLIAGLQGYDSLYVLGRGPTLAMANEAALKFKETCQIHAESYSSAEVLHGPVSIVGAGYPVLALAVGDAAKTGLVDLADGLAGRGARSFVTASDAKAAIGLPAVTGIHGLTDPLALIAAFYAFVEQFSRLRGFDPDQPRNLRKVTETV